MKHFYLIGNFNVLTINAGNLRSADPSFYRCWQLRKQKKSKMFIVACGGINQIIIKFHPSYITGVAHVPYDAELDASIRNWNVILKLADSECGVVRIIQPDWNCREQQLITRCDETNNSNWETLPLPNRKQLQENKKPEKKIETKTKPKRTIKASRRAAPYSNCAFVSIFKTMAESDSTKRFHWRNGNICMGTVTGPRHSTLANILKADNMGRDSRGFRLIGFQELDKKEKSETWAQKERETSIPLMQVWLRQFNSICVCSN